MIDTTVRLKTVNEKNRASGVSLATFMMWRLMPPSKRMMSSARVPK